MGVFDGWHLVVLALLVIVPIVVVAAIVAIVVTVTRSWRARSEERIAQRTAELLRSPDRAAD